MDENSLNLVFLFADKARPLPYKTQESLERQLYQRVEHEGDNIYLLIFFREPLPEQNERHVEKISDSCHDARLGYDQFKLPHDARKSKAQEAGCRKEDKEDNTLNNIEIPADETGNNQAENDNKHQRIHDSKARRVPFFS